MDALPCDECGAVIGSHHSSVVNTDHDSSCSLHPASVAAGLEVRTTDLRPGDVLVYADLVDTIVSVSDLGGCVMRVDVIRNDRVCHWFAGKRAKHVLVGQALPECTCGWAPRECCEVVSHRMKTL